MVCAVDAKDQPDHGVGCAPPFVIEKFELAPCVEVAIDVPEYLIELGNVDVERDGFVMVSGRKKMMSLSMTGLSVFDGALRLLQGHLGKAVVAAPCVVVHRAEVLCQLLLRSGRWR